MTSVYMRSIAGLLLFWLLAALWSGIGRLAAGDFSTNDALNQGAMYIYGLFLFGWIPVGIAIASVLARTSLFPTTYSKIVLAVGWLLSLAVPYFIGRL